MQSIAHAYLEEMLMEHKIQPQETEQEGRGNHLEEGATAPKTMQQDRQCCSSSFAKNPLHHQQAGEGEAVVACGNTSLGERKEQPLKNKNCFVFVFPVV